MDNNFSSMKNAFRENEEVAILENVKKNKEEERDKILEDFLSNF